MKDLGIESDPSFPYRPQSNPVETWMKPLGKCLSIANRSKVNNERAIKDLLIAYRTTPHPATGLSPGEMLFRHGFRGAFPNRKTCTPNEFKQAVKKMKQDKSNRCAKINDSVKRQAQNFKVGQWVYVRNRIRNNLKIHGLLNHCQKMVLLCIILSLLKGKSVTLLTSNHLHAEVPL